MHRILIETAPISNSRTRRNKKKTLGTLLHPYSVPLPSYSACRALSLVSFSFPSISVPVCHAYVWPRLRQLTGNTDPFEPKQIHTPAFRIRIKKINPAIGKVFVARLNLGHMFMDSPSELKYEFCLIGFFFLWTWSLPVVQFVRSELFATKPVCDESRGGARQQQV